MPGSRKSIDDDDNAVMLMPNVAKLIRPDSDSLESNGSTSMSLCGISGKNKVETQSAKPSRQRRAEAGLRDVANKFLRRGATGKRSIGACKPSTLDMLSSYHSSSADRRNVCMFGKENLRPKASALDKQGTLPPIQKKMATRDESQKAARVFRKNPTRSVVKLGQRRTVNPKIQGAEKSNTDMVPERLAKHVATVTSPKASHNSQRSEGSCYVSNLAAKSRRRKAKLYIKTTPLSLSELQEKFAELDGEALEEEEVSMAHLTIVRPLLASETVLQHAGDISEKVFENRKDLGRCGRADEVSATLIPNLEEATVPNYSHGQGQEGVGICTSQSKLSKTPGRDQVAESTCKENARGNLAASSGINRDAVTLPERQPSPSGCLNLDDSRVTLSKAFSCSQGSKRSSQFSSKVADQQQLKLKLQRKVKELETSEQQNMRVDEVDIGMKEGLNVHVTLTKPMLLSGVVSQQADGGDQQNVKCRNDENLPRFEDSASASVNGTEDKASSARAGAHGRTADTKTSPIPLDASAQDFSGKGTSVCAVFELEHAESSCNDKRGCSSLKPNEEKFKEVDTADANASHREDTVLGHTSTLREDIQSAPLKAKHHLEQEGVLDIVPLQEGTYPTRDTSATPPRNPLLLTCLHYSRIGRNTDMRQRRLVFDSSGESLSRQNVVDRNSDEVSVSSVEFKGRTDPATDVLNPDVHEYELNTTSIPHQEAKLPLADDEVIDHKDDRGCRSQISKAKAATHYEDLVEGEPPLAGFLAQDDNLPDFEASRGVMGTDPGIDSLGPQAGPATEVPRARGLGKRTLANLGDPIDGGTEWKKGRRVSTRIKSRPLDWWRGERMLYGRVHKTLCTLIGIKTTSPDPIWPRPKPQRGDYTKRNFHVDSFVGDSHRDLLHLAAQ